MSLTACSPEPTPANPPTLSLRTSPDPVRVGQTLSFSLGLEQGTGTWNVALFVEDPEGGVDQILPNRLPGGQPTLSAGQTVSVPGANDGFRLYASAPTGVHTALLYVTQRPLNLEGISAYANEGALFATVQANRQGVGSLEGSTRAALNALNAGTSVVSKFTVTD